MLPEKKKRVTVQVPVNYFCKDVAIDLVSVAKANARRSGVTHNTT